MRRRLALLTLVVVAGCGGTDDRAAQRDSAQHYVRAAQSAMARDAPGLRQANDAYVAYSRGKLKPAEAVTKMRAAQRTVTAVRDHVAVLDHDEPVATLHERLLRYLDLNRDLAAETTALAVYTPAAERALAPIGRVNRRLSARLDKARSTRAQTRALRQFADALDRVSGDLGALDPPPVLRPAHVDQVRRLQDTERLAAQLRTALARRDAPRVSALLKRFRAAARSGQGLPALSEQARLAYEARLTRLREADVAVHRESARLQRELR